MFRTRSTIWIVCQYCFPWRLLFFSKYNCRSTLYSSTMPGAYIDEHLSYTQHRELLKWETIDDRRICYPFYKMKKWTSLRSILRSTCTAKIAVVTSPSRKSEYVPQVFKFINTISARSCWCLKLEKYQQTLSSFNKNKNSCTLNVLLQTKWFMIRGWALKLIFFGEPFDRLPEQGLSVAHLMGEQPAKARHVVSEWHLRKPQTEAWKVSDMSRTSADRLYSMLEAYFFVTSAVIRAFGLVRAFAERL